MQTSLTSFIKTKSLTRTTHPKVPSAEWKPIHITYNQLKDLHPTPYGINYDSKGTILSIQMVIPNTYYDGDCFENDLLYYKPSVADKQGNMALDRAFHEGKTFQLYIRYKDMPEKLKELGIPKEHHGKCYSLGTVKVTAIDHNDYVIKKAL